MDETGKAERQRILLVEDQSIIAMAQVAQLKRNGYDVVVASSGAEAIQLATEEPLPDLVLMDIDLGDDMDGTEAASKILEMVDVPILFLSSHTEPELVARTEKITSYGYVVKQSGITVLLASMHMAFRLHVANRALRFAHRKLEQINESLTLKDKRLSEAEFKFRTVLDYSSDWGFWMDLDGKFVYMSPSCEEITGYSRNDFIRDPGLFRSILHPDDSEIACGMLDPQFAPMEPTDCEFRITTKQGHLKWLNLRFRTIQDEGGNVLGKRGSARDITDRKTAELEVLRSRESFRHYSLLAKTILDSPDGIIVFALDRSYRYLDFTSSHRATMKTIWGVDIAAGMDMLACIADRSDRERAKENFDRALSGERFTLSERYGKDAARCSYDDHYSPLYDEKGQIFGLSVFVVAVAETR